MNQTIVHEAEAQRQHVRVALPASLEIAGAEYHTKDWSVSGVALSLDKNSALKEKKRYSATLNLAFDGFKLDVPMELEVMHIADGMAGCRFVNQSEKQLSILQLLVSSYVSGELIAANDILDVVARHNFTQSRKPPSATAGLSGVQLAKRRLGAAIKSLIVLGFFGFLLFVVGNGLFERMFVVKAQTATVTAELLPIKSTAIGTVHPKVKAGSAVVKGEALFSLTREDGSVVSVDSPCDCSVQQLVLSSGSPVLKGQAVLLLAAMDATPFIEARVAYKDALKLKEGNVASLDFPAYGENVDAVITAIRINAGEALAEVILEPTQPLPASRINDPVEVQVNRLTQKSDI